MASDTTYLINLDGEVVHTWKSSFLPSAWVYLLDSGNLLRGASDPGSSGFSGGGQGGRFEEFDFDGNLIWTFVYNEGRLPHHNVTVLPNGNILAIVWESKTSDEARRAGRREELIPPRGVWPDMLIEFEPIRPSGARIVWEWHMWDHLIQNVDRQQGNFGEPKNHPERIDINGDSRGNALAPSWDLFHTNAVAYNADFDQLLLSVPTFNEVWVIDHSTTTHEAEGSTGGRSGRGGDLLYRWGNPKAYGRGTESDRVLGFQHDAHWIAPGLPGAGNILIFSTRTPGSEGDFPKVYEFAPAVNSDGQYTRPGNGPFSPAAPEWTYTKPDSFRGSFLSGSQRLANGNTFISAGPQGRMFEVTPTGAIVWEYWSPYGRDNGVNPFSLFRATRIPPEHPGLQHRDLRPLDPQPVVSRAASAIRPGAFVSRVTPSTGVRGTNTAITLEGGNFTPQMTLSLSGGVGLTITDVEVINSGRAVLSVHIDNNATLGPVWSFDVSPSSATGGSTCASKFAVVPQTLDR
jgi:hypothetical protein